MDELISRPRSPCPNAPARNQFRVSVQSNPSPNAPIPELALLVSRNILVLGVTELPNLIALDVLASEIAHRLILIFRTRFAQISEQLLNGVHRYASYAHDAAKGVSFDKGRDNLHSFLDC